MNSWILILIALVVVPVVIVVALGIVGWKLSRNAQAVTLAFLQRQHAKAFREGRWSDAAGYSREIAKLQGVSYGLQDPYSGSGAATSDDWRRD